MRLFVIISVMLILLTGWLMPAKATHLVGGDITYNCLGNNNYRITISLYIDCLNGEENAIKEDNPAFIGIFDATNPALYTRYDSISKTQPDVNVPPNFDNRCVNNPPATCLRKVTFSKTYNLPFNPRGYRVVYVRCCRNESITNFSQSAKIGATYFCDIPPTDQTVCNNSAVFKNYPPQIICVNNPLVYDHSATDPDGDSLSYEFCNAYPGGQPNDPKPLPDPNLPPPISNYYAPYTATNPMGGNPQVKIHPVTGIISGTPNTQGRYVVSVCCHEWRNGKIINTVKREFQFVVTNCSKAVVANMPQFSDEFNTYIVQCKGYDVKFINRSSGGFSYLWDFGIPGETSTEFEPTYTYPDTGIYTVKLVVNRKSTCPDSISRLVKVYPDYSANFVTEGLKCPEAPISFKDLSTGTYLPVISWNWNFGDGAVSSQQDPVHSYKFGGDYNVSLISKSIKGCTDTARKQLSVERFYPFAGNDTIIVKGEYINFKASGGIQYTWTPSDMLNFSDGSNPRGYYPDTGAYAYNVHIKSAYGCEGDDSIHVLVVGQSSIFMPSAFTPNGDGRNDVLKPMGVGYSDIKFFRVYNRFGELVYSTGEFFEGWDGRYNGQLAEMGTYFWVLKLTDRYGKDSMLKGDVTLLR